MSSTTAQTPTSPTCSDQASAIPRIPWRWLPAVTLAYAAAIALFTWPWLRSPSTQVLDHWDPPFHAWKLHAGATHILAGHILPPVDSNLYYPHPGAYYYEALHWPQTVLAAALESFGANPVLSYHITLVAFWALSGALFWALLRALRTGRTAALAGGLFFTLMPYRVSYLVEFNMQLAFGVVLFLLFVLRFLQRPCVGYAIGAALAWWLQATSELYQAVFVLAAVPFLFLALVAAHPRILRDLRRFWIPLAAASGLCLALSLLWLGPYLDILDSGTLMRTAKEMGKHALEPLSYFRHASWVSLLPSAHARRDEMCAYPTFAILLLATGLAVRRLLRDGRRPTFRSLAFVLASASVGFFVLAHTRPVAAETLLAAGLWCGIAALVAAAVSIAVRDASPERRVLAALGAMAVLSFFLSLGPAIGNRGATTFIPNPVFEFVFKHFHFLEGFRVISRFSLFVELFLCAAAAAGLDGLLRRANGRALRATVTVAALALFLPECRPAFPLRFRPVRDVSHSAAIQKLDEQTDPFVLAIVPMGFRDLDSEHMLTIERTDRLGVYAWGGTYPPYTMDVKTAFEKIAYGERSTKAVPLLRQLWPEALVLEDLRPFHTIPVPVADYLASLAPFAETLCDDGDFRLIRLLPDTEPQDEFIRLVRPDLLRANPAARFSLASGGAPADVWLDLNGRPVARWHVSGDDPLPVSVSLPANAFVDHLPNRLRFHADGDQAFRLADFSLFPGPADEPDPTPEADLPWIGTVRSLPPTATPFDIHYPHGLRLRGAERIASAPNILHIRYYFQIPRAMSKIAGLALCTGIAPPGGGNLFEHRPRFVARIDQNTFAAAEPGLLLMIDDRFPIPNVCPRGTPCEATFTLRAPSGRLLSGRDASGSKIRHTTLATFTAP